MISHTDIMACVAMVVEDVLVPRIVEASNQNDGDKNDLRGRFESALIRQVAVCCSQHTLNALANTPQVALGDFIRRLSNNLFSLRIVSSVPRK